MNPEYSRESRHFWAVNDGRVVETIGYKCNDAVWWCPTLGFSLTRGYHLFETRSEARKKAIQNLKREIAQKQELLSDLIGGQHET